MKYQCKCGSTKMFTEVKGLSTGLYCENCGKWIKWLNKDEIRLFNAREKMRDNLLVQLSWEDRLKKFINFLDGEIDRQLCRQKNSPEDNIQACCYAHAHEKDMNALINILEGREWDSKI